MIWFWSDPHFNHENIIEYCNRPFDSLEAMTETLIDHHNSVVSKGDLVYCLGDFCLTRGLKHQPLVESLLSRLNGNKQLICGNHDREAVIKAEGWSWVGDYKRITVDKQWIVLFHYPIRSWHGIHRDAWHLHGHCHGSLEDPGGKILDVGVDSHNYTPIPFDEVREFMTHREPLYADHHTG